MFLVTYVATVGFASSNILVVVFQGAFDVCRKVFVGGEETAGMTLNDKIDLFFNDYSIVPLFVQENYINVMPYASRLTDIFARVKHMKYDLYLSSCNCCTKRM